MGDLKKNSKRLFFDEVSRGLDNFFIAVHRLYVLVA